MKSDDIQRSVRPSSADRAAGDAPNIGRVARMPGTGLPKSKRRKRRGDAGDKKSRMRQFRKRVLLLWSLFLCLLVVAALGVFGWLWLIPKMREGARDAELARTNTVPEMQSRRVPSPSQEAAEALVRNALAVSDAAKVSSFFRMGKHSPADILGFLHTMQTEDGTIRDISWMGPMDANEMVMDGLVVTFRSPDGKPRNRLAILTPDEEGVWKVDFDAFARTNTPPWKEFLAGTQETAIVRVYVAPDNYYNGPFSDEKVWVCYGLAAPDMDQILSGYCKRGSAEEAALEAMLLKGTKLVRSTLEIRRVEGAAARQFEISRVVGEDWAVKMED